jgi:signal transduction histidine kinase
MGERHGTSAVDPVRAIVEHLADGIVIVDDGGIVRFANPRAAALLGRSRAELVGHAFGIPIPAGGLREVELPESAGGSARAEVHATRLPWGDDSAWLITLHELTHRPRPEAQAANQARAEFLTTMSHELRTPLNAVIGYAELLDLGLAGPLTEAQRQQLSRISASGRHLLGLVNEVLDLARVESGRLTVAKLTFYAADAAEGAIVLVQPLAEARAQALRFARGEARGPLAVGDPDRVRQILVNLLSNAVKFTAPGGRIALTIDVTDTPDPEARLTGCPQWVRFRVTDTGIGIAADQLEAVFAPFSQLQSGHTRRRDGSGLGLTISRRLARLMGGDLTVRSTPGQGSTFTLWLPAASAEAVAAERDVPSALSGRDPHVQGLSDVGGTLLRTIELIVDAFVRRLRTDAVIPVRDSFTFSQLADHTAALVAEIAFSLNVLEDAGGELSALMDDTNRVLRLLAERHATQRGRLGWSTAALRREYTILREEVVRAIRSRFPEDRDGSMAEAMEVVVRLLDQAEATGVRLLGSEQPGGDSRLP